MNANRKTADHCYELVKFFADGRRPEVVTTRVTADQAKDACNAPSTRRAGGWFIGYRRMAGFRRTVAIKPSATTALLALHNGLGAGREDGPRFDVEVR
jgi:hypothetical protein